MIIVAKAGERGGRCDDMGEGELAHPVEEEVRGSCEVNKQPLIGREGVVVLCN